MSTLSKETLAKKEKQRILDGFSDISYTVNKSNIEELKHLIDNQYEITEVKEDKYTLHKKFSNAKTFRISLTESCNYECFFCHEEGLDMQKKWDSKSLNDIYNLCVRAINHGYNDITFTGGEPLIKWKYIVEILSRLNAVGLSPDISIVTNAQLINDELIDALTNYKGKTKVNVSMHHTDEHKYLKITNPKRISDQHFKVVTDNIKKLTDRNIYTKLNFVVLKDINTSEDDLDHIIKLATDLKVRRVKFLELLITDKLIGYYKYHYTLDALIQTYRHKLVPVSRNIRTQIFKVKDFNLKVEFSMCPCSIGCYSCTLSSGLIVTSELKYHPCYYHSDKGLNMDTDEDFTKNIIKGLNIRENYGNKYGNKTPFVINERDQLIFKNEYQYIIYNTDIYSVSKLIMENKFDLVRYRKFNEINFSIEKNNAFLKLYKNTYEKNYYEVIKKIKITDINLVKTRFISDHKTEVPDYDKYIEKMNLLGIESQYQVDWEVHTYRKNDFYISISKNSITNDCIVLSTKKISGQVKGFNPKPLDVPVEQYILNNF